MFSLKRITVFYYVAIIRYTMFQINETVSDQGEEDVCHGKKNIAHCDVVCGVGCISCIVT